MNLAPTEKPPPSHPGGCSRGVVELVVLPGSSGDTRSPGPLARTQLDQSDLSWINGIFRDPQGHGTPNNGKRDPYYSHDWSGINSTFLKESSRSERG